MITNRSNHIPTFTASTTMQHAPRCVVRTFLNQNSCGMTTLQKIIVQ